MNKREIAIWAFTIAAGSTTFAACSQSATNEVVLPAQEGILLTAGLRSGQTKRQAMTLATSSGWHHWRVVDEPSAPQHDSRPPLVLESAEVDGVDFGIAGTMKLEFINDQLMATWFFPENMPAYRLAIAERPPMKHLRVEFGVDFQKRRYVRFEDARLREEMDNWIRKYS
jgi:hypothetical protein